MQLEHSLGVAYDHFRSYLIQFWLVAVCSLLFANGFAIRSTAQTVSVIDQCLEDPAFTVTTPRANDAPLVRRLYLDLIGIPPSLAEIRAYLADESPDRYATLIDQLLTKPEFVEHWSERFDVMLMERRPNTHVSQDEWMGWLRSNIDNNVPLHQWMAELISASGFPDDGRAPARFLLDRSADPHLITRDLGRIYFGRDLQCAQCHDHPSIDSYLQSDYHGLLGFVSSLSLVEVTEGEAKLQVIAEKPVSEVAFESVFDRGNLRRVLPHIPGFDELDQPLIIPGEEFLVSTKPNYPKTPKHSRRDQLADQIRSGTQQTFNQNLTNRIFSLVFGRGVIHPLDLQHTQNPPSNPQLLNVLSEFFVTNDFQLKPLVRELVLSKTYQRGSFDGSSHATNQAGASEEVRQLNLAIENQAATIASLELKSETARLAFEPVEAERITALATVDAASVAYSPILAASDKAVTELTATKQVLAGEQAKRALMVSARDAVSAASSTVGDDAELNGMVANLTGRCSALDTAISALETELATKQAAADAALAVTATHRQALVDAQAAAESINERHAIVRGTMLDLRAITDAAELERTRLGSRQRFLQHFADPIDPETTKALEADLADRFYVERLKPLSPEQLCWSMISVTGIMDQYIIKHAAALEQANPATDVQQQDAEFLITRRRDAVRLARAELQGNVAVFVSLYGAGPGQPQNDFFATPDQALFNSNGGSTFAWAAPGGINVAQQIVDATEAKQAAESLYLGVVGRFPSDDEISAVESYLAADPTQRPRLSQELVWSLMASAEFRFNH